MSSARYIEDDKHFSGRYSRNVFQTIWFAFRPVIGRVVSFLLIGLFARALLLYTSLILGYWADSFCKGQNCKALPTYIRDFSNTEYVRLILFVTLIGFVLNAFFRIYISRTSCLAASLLYDEVTMRTSRLPMTFFDTTPVGRIISRFSSDYGNVFRMLGGPMGEFLSILFDLVLMLVLMSVTNPIYIPFLLITAAVNFGVYKLNLNRLRTERRNVSLMRAPAIAHFSETIQGYLPIKVYGKEPSFVKRFSNFVDAFLIQRMRMIFFSNLFSVQMTSITLSLLLLTGFSGVYFVSRGYVSLGSLAVAFTFVMMASASMQQFFELIASLEEALTGVERLDDYLRRKMEPGSGLPARTQFAPKEEREHVGSEAQERTNVILKKTAASLEVKDLTLRYRSDLPLSLNGVSFRLDAGKHLGIIGKTGAGKSSLIQALFHLYSFESGKILIDGTEAAITNNSTNGVPLRLFRSLIGYIPQDPVLFRATLRDNLSPRRTHTDAQLENALTLVGLDEWLAELGPRPFDFFVEERGSNLSVGQRQLLCMARCLLQETPIILMDEATSAIDPQSEHLLTQALEKHLKDRTQIIVAHRLSTVERCDEILWLDKGKVQMYGKPGEVLSAFRAFERTKQKALRQN